jgi:hypothetical protein
MDPRIASAIEELKRLIADRYPEAHFTTFKGEDPEGFYLRATIDREDSSDAMEVVLDKLYELQVEEGLPLYVVTSQPPRRVAATLRARAKQPRPALADLFAPR